MKLLRLVSIVMLSVCAVALGQSSDKPLPVPMRRSLLT